MLDYFSTADCEVCGIVNSDVSLKATKELIPFLQAETKNSLVTGCRVDVESEDSDNGAMYPMGFDYFFFDKSVIKAFPKDSFIIGAPWWDYWAVFVPLTQGIPVKQFVPPIGYHPDHPYKWNQDLWYSLSNRIYQYIYKTCGPADVRPDALQNPTGSIMPSAMPSFTISMRMQQLSR